MDSVEGSRFYELCEGKMGNCHLMLKFFPNRQSSLLMIYEYSFTTNLSTLCKVLIFFP